MTLMLMMKKRFGLVYDVREAPNGINATGVKVNYFLRNRIAEAFGYSPPKKSLGNILDKVQLHFRKFIS